jgi:2-polyprenyl-3-methyl-5-hydroxy-6-metoxy-1,4-benzoquinol methylase
MTAVQDQAKSDAFGERMVQLMNTCGLALMTSVGHRTRLFDIMAGLPESTSTEIAAKSGLNERYVREWLGSMVTGGVVDFDPAAKTYRLPPEHGAWLTRAASPNNLASAVQWLAVLGQVEDEIVEAFVHGRGVPYSSYPRFHEVMAEESAQTVVAALIEHILPLVPGLISELERGINVLDVGCGAGRAMIFLAEQFPRSQFFGYDFSAEGIGLANVDAKQRGLANARFEVKDVAAFDDVQRFDLITAFDAIHDQAKPDAVLTNVARALKPEGTFLMQDIMGSGYVEHDVSLPLATFCYAISCMHCMSVSLANGGPGLGAMWGKEIALKMLEAAGFKNVQVQTLPHDMINYYYICRLK